MKALLNLKLNHIILIGIINIILIYLNGTVSIYNCNYNHLILFLLNAIMGTIIWFNISKFMYKLTYFRSKNFIKYVEFIGNNSIILLVINQLIILVLKNALVFLGYSNLTALKILYYVIMLLGSNIILTLIGIWIKRTPLKIIFGISHA